MTISVREAGKIGGSVKSKEKTRSSRANGLLGGRPISAIEFNERGGINGCNHVYAPKGQAFEYAELSANPYSGCGHKCAYCYVPKVLRMSNRADFDSFAGPRNNFLNSLLKDARKYQRAGVTKQVMLSFTTDPYHPFDTSLTRSTIQALIEHGLGVSILTKGGSRAERDFGLLRPHRDCFGSTITSTDDEFSKKWESGAALATERIATLRAAHELGLFTWVSIEPTLDTNAALDVIRQTSGFVDLFKVGRVNYSGLTKQIDWESYTHDVIELLDRLGQKHYIKKDLQRYLPENYYNPLRIDQHH